MNRNPLIVGLLLFTVATSGDRALGHDLWIVPESTPDGTHVANLYFEHSAKPGDGHYLDHFLGTSDVWIRTLANPNPPPQKATEINQGEYRWMQVPLPEASEFSIDSYGKFGVYAYGQTKVLLHYYAKTLKLATHDAIHELGRAEQMELDLVPHDVGQQLEVKLLWQGEPVSGRMVFVRGPGGFRNNAKTDKRGRILLQVKDGGRYTFRSSVEVPTAGTDDGEAYELIRHNITLLMNLPFGDES